MAYDDLMAFRSQVRYDLCSGADMCDLLPGRAAQGISPRATTIRFFILFTVSSNQGSRQSKSRYQQSVA